MRTTRMRRLVSRARAGLAVITVAGIAAASVVCGCGRPGQPTQQRADAAPFAEQVRAVRTGTATRIVADAPLGDADWESLRGLATVRELVLRRGIADDSRADILGSLSGVERLVLRESPLGDAGLRAIAGLTRLSDLNVPQAACTAEGVRALRALPGLRLLRLGGRGVAAAGIGAAVAELSSLRSLHLIDLELGDAELDALADLEGLWNLYVDGAGLSDEAWARYFRVRPRVHVHVDQAHHDRDPGRGHDAPAAVSTRSSEDRR